METSVRRTTKRWTGGSLPPKPQAISPISHQGTTYASRRGLRSDYERRILHDCSSTAHSCSSQLHFVESRFASTGTSTMLFPCYCIFFSNSWWHNSRSYAKTQCGSLKNSTHRTQNKVITIASYACVHKCLAQRWKLPPPPAAVPNARSRPGFRLPMRSRSK